MDETLTGWMNSLREWMIRFANGMTNGMDECLKAGMNSLREWMIRWANRMSGMG